ncbi:SDR family oxidoreductase [Halioglobus maricola]|uniref:SDR family oxidoreductase n=1 Tax=Halioglobus maricola TaxID=2601894 RepID=A0A5P9NNI8_9GAMM|nr:SDR family oxidoreductase [Halioglobus maricola]QFU77229.1 SDR family oxidoreductase [Halioglobus maricola]
MKTVLITGAAQGIGLETARRYASQGWFVGLYDLNGEMVGELLSSADFPQACGGYCDVTDQASVAAMIEDFAEHSSGRLDLLINNAGVLSAGKFQSIEARAHDLMIDVNIRGATLVLQCAFELLSKTPGATVVNLCSASSIHGIPLLAVYSASKFYIDGITEALDLEWREHDIRVTCVKPPVINTAMGQVVDAEMPQKLGVKFGPEDVAEHIQRAAEGSGTSFPMGLDTKAYYWVDKFLPNFLRHPLTKYLTGK